MEAQSFCTAQSIHNLKFPLYSTKISSFSSFSSSSQPTKKVSFKCHISYANSHINQPKKSSSFRVFAESVEIGSIHSVEEEVRKKNLAIFVSGGGSNFRAIHQAAIKGSVHGNVAVLVTNKQDCGGANYARDNGIPVILFPSEGISAEKLVTVLKSYNIDFVLLAGYLKLIPSELIQAYPRSVFNIHPSLLPSFGGKGYFGKRVHKAVIASGARYSGATIHHVDEKYDTGRILAQTIVHVLANDTFEDLATRVLHEEHKLYVEVARALCDDRLVWREDGVPMIRSNENPSMFL